MKSRTMTLGQFTVGMICLAWSGFVSAQPCIVPDNGSGTVNLPPPGCGYLSPADVHEIIDGLPPGTTIQLGAEHRDFFNSTSSPGGPLGGEVEQFSSGLFMQLTGTGDLTGYNRTVFIPNVQCMTATAPRGGPSPQSFATDMMGIQGLLPVGDPDFDLLRITGGTNFGMPSPGHTTLTQLPGGNWNVDSFFDIDYRIDFVGRAGGPLGGMSGSTTGTIRMQTGGPIGGVACCLPLGLCVTTSSAAICQTQGGVALPSGATCQGDGNNDGIDDACFAPPCDECGPGAHWIHLPPCPPGGTGQDNLPSGAVFGIDLTGDCIAETNVIAGGPVTIRKAGPADDATSFPGTRPIDGHLDVVDTEIVGMSLTGGGVTLRAGTMSGSVQPLQPTLGAVAEQPGDPSSADSFFDVFFEVDLGGTQYYNQTPYRLAQVVDCLPPQRNYHHLAGCVPLYTSPFPGGAAPVAWLVQANHFTYPACCGVTGVPGGCQPNVSVAQCQAIGGTTVPACLGDINGNGIDDACDPKCERDATSPTKCSNDCPIGTPAGYQCLPSKGGCDPINQGTCGVQECACTDPNFCRLVYDIAGPQCINPCPDPASQCQLLGTGSFTDPYHCECSKCEPNSTGTGCTNGPCPVGPGGLQETCEPKCVNVNPATGVTTVTQCNCAEGDDCRMKTNLTTSGGVVAGPGINPACLAPDVGNGTVTLPPPGIDCGYISPDDLHVIINGLPAGTTIEVGVEHERFFCPPTPIGTCSFTNPPPAQGCDQQGGSLGGEMECRTSDLALSMTGTGSLAGVFNRMITLPVEFETHLAPRTPGDPVQSFDTDMFRLFGQITNPGSGDPDFDLLRITAGTNYGLPSPGHTTLTRMGGPGSGFAVDSFFDITYRIDFIGRPGGALGGMSGSTTGTIRMATQSFSCDPTVCPQGTQCVPVRTPLANGTIDVCCECQPIVCEPDPAGVDCNPNSCPVPGMCVQRCADYDPLTGQTTLTNCDCDDPATCHLETGAAGALQTAGGGPPCTVPDNGGTVYLPPPGCGYLSPNDVHEIIDGLPAGTTIQVAAEHKGFFCSACNSGPLQGHACTTNADCLGGQCRPAPNPDCSHPVDAGCNQPGGNLGGESECSQSTLELSLTGTGGLAGFNRNILMSSTFETHTAPRNSGDPVQSFDTEMFKLQGQLPAGDPDFDLLRITAGSGYSLPSPGHTTLTQLPGGNWAVDSFFDIEYRIDFIGAPGGPLAGRSGSTTATIRMATNAPFKCRNSCPVGSDCKPTTSLNADGSLHVCCDCVTTQVCEPTPDQQGCNPNTCPPGVECRPKRIQCTPGVGCQVVECDCNDGNACHPEMPPAGATEPICTGSCPIPPNNNRCVKRKAALGGGVFEYSCRCVPVHPQPIPDTTLPSKNRTVSMSFDNTTAGPPSGAQAIRIKPVDLQNPVPLNPPCCPPQNFGMWEVGTCTATNESGGCARWVGQPGTFREAQDNILLGTYRAARLVCSPYFHDWSSEGMVHVVGPEIMPSSLYQVQYIDVACSDTFDEDCFSEALEVPTARWGDVASPFAPVGTQPDPVDVVALVNKFRNQPGAPPKAVAQLQPNLVELNVDVGALDIVGAIDGFRGNAYPYSGPCPCPSPVTCNAISCNSPTPCSGGLCIRTCVGGPNDGAPCLNLGHCPSGTCGQGFCRDRCGRCSP